MKTLLVCTLTFVSSFVFAQSKPDETRINKLIDDLILAFNTHDFTTLKDNSTDDVSWVNIVGMWWKGRNEVVGAHNGVFNTIFDILANVIIHVGEFFPPDGVDHGTNKQKAANDILTLVYVKRLDRWLLTAGHNTVIDANAVPPKK
ncbi:MAG: SgcJ/EcaC family oxidoreductase [Chitinophagaceae bacterium]|nr:MAG: SgcJ/EcaC family oxidoreductase [Chitinophagaceae bacterium]